MPADEKPPSSAAGPGAAAPTSGPRVESGHPEPPPDDASGAPGQESLPEAFLALASHELRTPLQAIGLQLEMMRGRIAQAGSDVPTDWVLERLERVGKLVKRSTRLLENLLDVSDIAHGQHGLRREAFDLGELAEEVVAANAEALRWARCPCALERRGPLPGRWDRPRIERALENLLANAMKYAAGSPIQVRVWAEEGEAFLSVGDGGPGIAPDDQRRIFARFVRGSHPGSVEGFGLGLWIVKTIAEEHGGAVELASAPGGGAMFTIRLPRR